VRISVSLVILLALGLKVHSQIIPPMSLGLKQDQIPQDCKEITGSYPIDMQTAILWARTDLYKEEMPVVAKNAQSFNCHGEKGMVYQFQFASDAQRSNSERFIKPLLWGEPKPSEEHPELVLENGNVLTVISFRKSPPSLLAALQNWVDLPSNGSAKIEGDDFSVPGHGTLRLKMPSVWQNQTKPTSEPPSVTVRFTPATGNDFDIYVTAVWLDAEKLRNITPDWLRKDVQGEAEKLLPRAVEKVAKLHELRGTQCIGFYYALTDRESKPGEYKYMTQGIFLTGELLTTFTALHRDMESPDVPKALEGLAAATYTK